MKPLQILLISIVVLVVAVLWINLTVLNCGFKLPHKCILTELTVPPIARPRIL